MYPDDIGPMHPGLCLMEGCIGKGPCPRCGKTNYRWMGFWGAVARWAKAWGISEEEALARIETNQIKATRGGAR